MLQNNRTLNFEKIFSSISFILLVLFSFIAPLKFGIPYTYNIEQTVPLDFLESFFLSWPTEWGIIILLISSLFYLISIFKKNNLLWNINYLDIAILIWMFFVLISFIFNGIKSGGLQTTLVFTSYGLYYFLLKLNRHSEEKKEIILTAVLSAAVICVLYGFYQYYQGLDETLEMVKNTDYTSADNPSLLRRLTGKKIFSTFIYSNSFAGFITILIPFFTISFFDKKQHKMLIKSGIIGLMFFLVYLLFLSKFNFVHYYFIHFIIFPVSIIYMLFLTLSKAGMATFILSFFIALLFLLKNKGYKILLIITFSMMMFFAITLNKQISLKLSKSMQVRMEYNHSTVQIIKNNFFLGSGPGSYGTQYMKYKLPQAEEVQLAHNSFLQVFSETGIFSFISFISIFFIAFTNLSRKKDIFSLILIIALLAIVIHNLFDFDFYVPSIGYLTFFIISLTSVTNNQKKGALSSKFLKTVILLSIFTILVLINLLARISESIVNHEKGYRLIETGKPLLAIECYKNAVNAYQFNPGYYVYLADLYFMNGNFEQAEEIYAKAKELLPDNAIIWYKQASCMLQRDLHRSNIRKNEIKESYEKALSLYPESVFIKNDYQKFIAFINKTSELK